ncbi:hypothetical protein LCGC14_2705190 [marine sediment metagenome]|uniref:Uncharacterized protein n=1 Tax=marine sediment metagenome TaxID=412755 RepID=A0A0F9BNP5_9ZZZZ
MVNNDEKRYWCVKCAMKHNLSSKKGQLHRKKTKQEKKEELERIFYKSLKKNYNKLVYPDGSVAIDALYRKVHDDTYLVRDQFTRHFWRLEGKKFSVISKRKGLPIYGPGIEPYTNTRLYKLQFYR